MCSNVRLKSMTLTTESFRIFNQHYFSHRENDKDILITFTERDANGNLTFTDLYLTNADAISLSEDLHQIAEDQLKSR